MAIDANKIWDWSIYKMVSPSGRIYIGITTNVQSRRRDYEKIDCPHQIAVFNSLKKYGFESHSFEVIETFSSNVSYAYGKEIFWIRTHLSNYSKWPQHRGLNLTEGGRGSHGRVVSEDTKEKLRKANLGKKYSNETKAKLSAMRKGKKINRVWTDEQKKVQSERVKGFKHTEDAKKKISEAGLGNKYCLGQKQSKERVEQTRQRHIGNKYNLGRKQSQEEKDKRADKNRGLKRSETTKILLRKIQSEKNGQKILQLDINGNIVNEFPSILEAARQNNVGNWRIKDILKGRVQRITPHLFFKYKQDVVFDRIVLPRRIFELKDISTQLNIAI